MAEENVRPWGRYDVIYEDRIGEVTIKVKKIKVNPNQRLSLQYHGCRDEYWSIIEGFGEVERNDEVLPAKCGDEFLIPRGMIHRITAGPKGINFLEIAVGHRVDESDIVRVKDDYGRVE